MLKSEVITHRIIYDTARLPPNWEWTSEQWQSGPMKKSIAPEKQR
jgi:hypothetical protein